MATKRIISTKLRTAGWLGSLAILFGVVFVAGPAYASQAALSWTAPTTNENGTPLTDLAGYKVYYGTVSGNYTSSEIDVGNVTSYTVTGLSENESYYFVVRAYNSTGAESSNSNEAALVGTGVVSAAAGGGGCGIIKPFGKDGGPATPSHAASNAAFLMILLSPMFWLGWKRRSLRFS